jgi:glycosyltransferase involved in cell wall biosynthesis
LNIDDCIASEERIVANEDMSRPALDEGSGGGETSNAEGAASSVIQKQAQPLISIVLCTRNRADKLRQALQSILALKVQPGGDFEVIVADNGSTDDTAQVCAGMAAAFGGRLYVLFVPKPGKSWAHNAGIKQAKGAIIAMTDDDVYPQSDWLELIWREFSIDPTLQVVGGRVELFNPADHAITVRRQTAPVAFQTLMDSFNLMVGCNCAARRELFERIGCFDVDFGPGSRFQSADDSDFFFRVWRSGAKLVYEPSLFVFHDHGRRTSEDRLSIRRSYAVGRGAFYAKHLSKNKLLILRTLVQELEWGLKALLTREGDRGWQIPWLIKGFTGYCWMRMVRLFNPTSRIDAPGVVK